MSGISVSGGWADPMTWSDAVSHAGSGKGSNSGRGQEGGGAPCFNKGMEGVEIEGEGRTTES